MRHGVYCQNWEILVSIPGSVAMKESVWRGKFKEWVIARVSGAGEARFKKLYVSKPSFEESKTYQTDILIRSLIPW